MRFSLNNRRSVASLVCAFCCRSSVSQRPDILSVSLGLVLGCWATVLPCCVDSDQVLLVSMFAGRLHARDQGSADTMIFENKAAIFTQARSLHDRWIFMELRMKRKRTIRLLLPTRGHSHFVPHSTEPMPPVIMGCLDASQAAAPLET